MKNLRDYQIIVLNNDDNAEKIFRNIPADKKHKTFMKKIYIVKLSKEQEGFNSNVFATHDKSIADNWILKFNTKLNNWKEILLEYQDEYNTLDEKYWNCTIAQIYYKIKNINYAFYETIELR